MGMAKQDVSNRIVSVINRRNEELKQGMIHSDIVIHEENKEETQQMQMMKMMAEMKLQMEQMKADLDAEKLKNQNRDKQEEVNDSKKIHETNKIENNSSSDKKIEVDKEKVEDTNKKSVGRPKTK
jgi:MarR-like DNA-binding transcriptional regulator SgrR of sgrS sRNA